MSLQTLDFIKLVDYSSSNESMKTDDFSDEIAPYEIKYIVYLLFLK